MAPTRFCKEARGDFDLRISGRSLCSERFFRQAAIRQRSSRHSCFATFTDTSGDDPVCIWEAYQKEQKSQPLYWKILLQLGIEALDVSCKEEKSISQQDVHWQRLFRLENTLHANYALVMTAARKLLEGEVLLESKLDDLTVSVNPCSSRDVSSHTSFYALCYKTGPFRTVRETNIIEEVIDLLTEQWTIWIDALLELEEKKLDVFW